MDLYDFTDEQIVYLCDEFDLTIHELSHLEEVDYYAEQMIYDRLCITDDEMATEIVAIMDTPKPSRVERLTKVNLRPRTPEALYNYCKEKKLTPDLYFAAEGYNCYGFRHTPVTGMLVRKEGGIYFRTKDPDLGLYDFPMDSEQTALEKALAGKIQYRIELCATGIKSPEKVHLLLCYGNVGDGSDKVRRRTQRQIMIEFLSLCEIENLYTLLPVLENANQRRGRERKNKS